MGILGIKADKAVTSRDGRFELFCLVIGVGQVQQRLLPVNAERETGFEELVILDRLAVIAGIERALGLGVEAFHRPVLGLITILVAEPGATAEQQECANTGYQVAIHIISGSYWFS